MVTQMLVVFVLVNKRIIGVLLLHSRLCLDDLNVTLQQNILICKDIKIASMIFVAKGNMLQKPITLV